MKFGKRLLAEAERQWRDNYIDYKALKRAIQADVDSRDAQGRAFEAAIRQELDKVSVFYVEKEGELQSVMEQLSGAPPEAVAALRSQVQGLRKYVVLNYVCVVKAAKKRNRHLRAVCGGAAAPVKAVDILAHQYFFTSPRLASIATQAEILSKSHQPVTDTLLQDYQCPICLGLLRGAVVLTCAHRYCWGCLVAHCTMVMGRLAAAGPAVKDVKEGAPGGADAAPSSTAPASNAVVLANWEGEASDEETTLATFDCPVCRKAQLLDLDRLHVDPHLDAFVRNLERQGQQGVATVVVEEEDQCSQPLEPMAVDFPQQARQAPGASPSTPARPLVPGHVTSTEAPLLKVEQMDAVLEYLHKEHRALEEERRQRAAQQVHAAPAAAAAAAQPLRSASQPVAISGTTSSHSQTAEEMEVDGHRPSVRSGLLAASEDGCEATSQLRPAPMSAAVAAAVVPPAPPRRKTPPLAPAPAPATAAPAAVFNPAASPFAPSAAPEVVLEQREPPLLPPQRPEDQGKITVCLDLDGTLVTTFTPKRAPVLPSTAISYIVGRGGKLNPGGVFVVERPGLGEFFRRITPMAEVVLFTAGLEDYAKPICDALEEKYNCFLHRLYRPACVQDEVYPCVKDMSRLGRDLGRCVLVDDTPLAFFRQPDNGIPVLQFRGDVDDQLLTEAVAPLIESLHTVPDVRAALSRRFQMTRWFQSQGLMLAKPALPMHRAPSMPTLPRQPAPVSAAPRSAQLHAPHQASNMEVLNQQRGSRSVLLVCDFDKTLINYDAGERLCDELAPELTSLLSSVEMPANFVPVTNTVLAEMQRRGVSRDRILTTLRAMGQEMPLASVRMLQWASRAGIEAVVLSDCNSTVINSVLTGAKVNSCLRGVVTNLSSFVRVEEAVAPAEEQGKGGSWLHRTFGGGSGAAAARKPSSHRLVITPRHDYHAGSHGCPLCPENLCKGRELEALWGAGGRPRRTVYCGDGINDACPALCLGPEDVVLARKGYALDHFIQKRAGAPDGVRRVRAEVHTWSTHEELWALAQEAACI